MKKGDLLTRRMDETSWLVLDLYFDDAWKRSCALMMNNETGVRRWVFKEEWSQYEL